MKNLMMLAASVIFLAMTGGCYTVTGAPPTGAQRADDLARGVAQAAGGELWPRINTIAFTYVVREGDAVKLTRSHLWNFKTGTDTVTVGGKTTTIDLRHPNADDADQTEILKTWDDDTNWVLAPLRLFVRGVNREYVGSREIEGKRYEVLHLYFAGPGTDPAQSDQYDLYVDPFTNVIAYSDYIPPANPQEPVRSTWEHYRHKSGLKLATVHRMGGKTISIEDLSVSVE
jgi:hypothetical protein